MKEIAVGVLFLVAGLLGLMGAVCVCALYLGAKSDKEDGR